MKIRGKQAFKGFLFLLLLILLTLVSACKKEVKTSDEEAIKDTIVKFDTALIEVYKKLDPKPLVGLASQREVGKNADIVVGFINKKVYLDSELHDVKFELFTRKEKDEIDVLVKEKWRWRHLEIGTGKEVKPWVREEYTINYHMVKEKKKWIIGSLNIVTHETKEGK